MDALSAPRHASGDGGAPQAVSMRRAGQNFGYMADGGTARASGTGVGGHE
ncbi:hypothetical protein ACIRD6_17695 [Streptomyces sp. NPDC102473]